MRTTNVPRLSLSDSTVGIGIAPIHTKRFMDFTAGKNFTYPQRLIYFVYELIVTLLLTLCKNNSFVLKEY